MNTPAKLSDLVAALDLPTDVYQNYFDRQTGEVVMVEESLMDAAESGDEEELTDVPDWQKEQVETARAVVNDDSGRFIAPPDKFDFHEYHQMELFIETLRERKSAEELWRAIKGSGAFRRFRDSVTHLGLLERWYEYRDNAMKEFVIEWAEENDVRYIDDLQDQKKSARRK